MGIAPRLGATPREVGNVVNGVPVPLQLGVHSSEPVCMRPLGLLFDALPVAGPERLREVARFLAPLGRTGARTPECRSEGPPRPNAGQYRRSATHETP